MNVKSFHQAERDTQRIQTSRTELIERMVSVLPEDGSVEPLPGLSLARRSAPQEPLHGVFKPTLCVIAQGSKEVLLGDSRYRYDPLHYLLVTVNLPTVTQVLQASNEQPYLSFSMELSPTLVSSVMVELGYNLAGKALSAVRLQSARIYVNAFNLFTITKVKDYDPEGNSGSGQFYPQQRIINVGVNVRF